MAADTGRNIWPAQRNLLLVIGPSAMAAMLEVMAHIARMHQASIKIARNVVTNSSAAPLKAQS